MPNTSRVYFCHPSTKSLKVPTRFKLIAIKLLFPNAKPIISTSECSQLRLKTVQQYNHGQHLQGHAMARKWALTIFSAAFARAHLSPQLSLAK